MGAPPLLRLTVNKPTTLVAGLCAAPCSKAQGAEAYLPGYLCSLHCSLVIGLELPLVWATSDLT